MTIPYRKIMGNWSTPIWILWIKSSSRNGTKPKDGEEAKRAAVNESSKKDDLFPLSRAPLFCGADCKGIPPQNPSKNFRFRNYIILPGGFKCVCFCFAPDTWGNDPIWRAYFSNGLVQPPTSNVLRVWIARGVKYHLWGWQLGSVQHAWLFGVMIYIRRWNDTGCYGIVS